MHVRSTQQDPGLLKTHLSRPHPVIEMLEGRQLLSATITTLASFNVANGYKPAAGLVADSAGNLYGTTPRGGSNDDGTVFELSGPNHATLTTLVTFNSVNGANPEGRLIIDSAGNLYGTTALGGKSGDGTVFELSGANHTTLTTLVAFSGANGDQPYAGLTADASGNYYGTTKFGGAFDNGSVFELSGSKHTTLNTLTSFPGTHRSEPLASVTVDAAGNLYGTTSGGGTFSDGTVFELSGTNHTTLKTLATFNGDNGLVPESDVTVGTDGNLYGTTVEGGAHNNGLVFELSGSSHTTLTTLVTFNGSINGQNPEGGLIEDAAGNLYGTTNSSFEAGRAGVFKISAATHILTVLGGNDPSNEATGSQADLLADSSGNLYGTTGLGKNGDGSVFELTGSGFVVPSINLTAPINQTASAGIAKSFALGTFKETGAVAPYSVDVNWGDGTADTRFAQTLVGTISAQSHTFAKAGIDTVTVTLTDAQSHTSNTVTFKVTVSGVIAPTASISGRVFSDINGNGKRDVGEIGLGLWTVYLDLNRDGKLDSGDKSVVTDINGNWLFSGLAAGTYTIRIVPVAGDSGTTPANGAFTLNLATAQASLNNLFGERSVN